MKWSSSLWVAVGSLLLFAAPAGAFCGFYVGGGTTDLYNNATQVVLMREGTTTVLSMENNYEGPPENFALVIPVPVVLEQENVLTLPTEVFDRVDQMGAPRLVEYWEQDPCSPQAYYLEFNGRGLVPAAPTSADRSDNFVPMVVVEAQFEVGEYEIVILSANDSTALDGWLRQNGYNIPEGAEVVLRPYIEAGMKFFVAKVNSELVTFSETGQAMLSPLRFHYESETFELPIRLGMLNAKDAQDLIVHILAPGQRYEVANYENVTIPTNIEVADVVQEQFASFYASLFDKTLEENPGAVITEYSWDAGTCDPCPGPTLTEGDMLTLGADVLPSRPTWGLVLTRLHTRYTTESLGEDLVFSAAPPIVGGREWIVENGELERGSRPDSTNNFQGRYIIRHYWEGELTCDFPTYGNWGGAPTVSPAQDVAFADRDAVVLVDALREPVPELGIGAELITNPIVERVLPEIPTGPIEIGSGFSSATRGGIAGGPNAAATTSPGCVGYVAMEPNHTIVVTESTVVSIIVTSSGDPTLLLTGPTGMECNDDYNGLQPAIFTTLTPGTYKLFVGTYGAPGTATDYRLNVAGPL